MATKRFPLEIIISAVDKFTGTFAKFGDKLDRIGKKANMIGKELSLKVTAPMLLLGRFALQSAGSLEQLEIRFTSLVGSAEKAADLMERLKTFTAVTPFDLQDVANAAAGLLAAGFAAENLEDDLKILGDIAAGSGGRLADMVPLYTELRIKGKAFTQDLRQFATRGIPIISVLAQQLGKSEAAIFKMAEKGKLTFPLIQKALQSMTEEGGLFANQMDKQSRSIFGIWETFKDTVSFAAAEIGNAAVKATDLGGKLERLGNGIQRLTLWFKNLTPFQQKALVYFALFITVLGPLLVILGQIAMALSFLPTLFGNVTAAVAFLLKPVSLIMIGLGVMLWQFSKLSDMAGGFGNALMVLGGVLIDAILSPLQWILKVVINLWNKLGTAPAWLTKAANFSFGQAAADRAEGVSAASPGAGQRFATTAAAAAAGGAAQAKLEVQFKNAPAGVRASVVENQNTNVTLDQGIAMQGGY